MTAAVNSALPLLPLHPCLSSQAAWLGRAKGFLPGVSLLGAAAVLGLSLAVEEAEPELDCLGWSTCFLLVSQGVFSSLSSPGPAFPPPSILRAPAGPGRALKVL